MIEDEMAGWHHWLNGRESDWTPGVGDGQGGLACCDSWGHKESETTERLNWTELKGNQPWIFIERTHTEVDAQYFGRLIQRADSLEKVLMLEKIQAKRRGRQWMRWLDGIINTMDMNQSKLRESVKDREAWRATVHGVKKSRTGLSNWTTIPILFYPVLTFFHMIYHPFFLVLVLFCFLIFCLHL